MRSHETAAQPSNSQIAPSPASAIAVATASPVNVVDSTASSAKKTKSNGQVAKKAAKAKKTVAPVATSSAPTASPLPAPEPVKVLPKHIAPHQATPTKHTMPGPFQTPNSAENRSSTASRLARNIAASPKHATPKGKSLLSPLPANDTPSRQREARTPMHYQNRVARNQQVYPEYMSLEKAREEVAAGRAWEGVLRANPNASRMCFFTVPGRLKDLMVKDEWLNRAFPGDTVIITMLSAEDLEAEELFQERRNSRKRGGGNSSQNGKNQGENGADSSQTPTRKSRPSASSSTSSDSPSPSPSNDASNASSERRLRSEVLKGVESDDHETASDYSRDDSSIEDPHLHDEPLLEEDEDSDVDVPHVVGVPHDEASISRRLVAPKTAIEAVETSKKPSEDEIAAMEAEMSMLNMTTHATFTASNYAGILEEDKPKSELAKVIHIVNPFHEQIGYVGQLRRRSDGGFELRPLAAQHPIFDVPAPETRFLADIPDYEPKEASKKRRRQPKKQEEENIQLFITKFRRWNTTSRRPLGDKPEWIGEAGDVAAECKAITSTHMIDTSPHPASLSSEFGTSTEIDLNATELARRKDLRATRIFTVDPPTARDIDDALSIEKIGEDRFRVGVHIADVSHYVSPGSKLDNVAKVRSTSVYMVNTMYPMLPSALSENLCSLNPKVDRYAFSVMWDLDSQGNIIGEEWIGRTIVRSCVKLSYTDAQIVIDAKEQTGDLTPAIAHLAGLKPEHTPESIAEDILNLNMLAQRMRERRFAGGALRLSRLRLHFELGLDGYPMDAHPYYIKESNQLIEEFMLLANMSVAKFIFKAFPQSALLRAHPMPKDDVLETFGHLMQALGIPFDTSSSGSLYRSLLQLEPWQQRPIEEMVTKAMNAAIYLSTGSINNDESSLWHYALNVPFYTHFTSPIRRYPDIVVHRQIQAAIDKNAGKLMETEHSLLNADPCHDPAWVAEVSDHANERKRSARKAQDDSIKLFCCLYLKNAPFVDPESIVLDVSRNKISVFSPHLCLRLRIDIAEKKGFTTKFDQGTRVLSVIDQNSRKCVLAITYFSKISITYYTKGRMPMDVGAELSLWYKPQPSPADAAASKNAQKAQDLRAASAPPATGKHLEASSSSSASPSRNQKGKATPSKAQRAPNASGDATDVPASSSNTPAAQTEEDIKRDKRNKRNKRRNKKVTTIGQDGEIAAAAPRSIFPPSESSSPAFSDA
jgi:VacB/RNase II family 3'-5' exoribonuclease